MKKIFALLLLILMVALFTACGQTKKAKNFLNAVSISPSEKANKAVRDSVFRVNDTKIEELLNSYWSCRYICSEERFVDGYGKLKSFKTDENGVVVKRFYTWKSVEYNPAENTLIICGFSTDGTEEDSKSIVSFNENNQPISDGENTFKYDENENLVERKTKKHTYTYEYSEDKKTVTEYTDGILAHVYKYDDNGYLIGLTAYDKFGDWYNGIAYENDEQGRRLKTYLVDKNGNAGNIEENYTYDQEGNLTSFYI